MSNDISEAFIKEYEANVHMAYQRKGSKLLKTVERKTNVKGSTTVCFSVGRSVASTKARHGLVPTMDGEYTAIECQLHDYYCGRWSDRLDELKTNVNEQKIAADSCSFALGRQSDQLITEALDQGTHIIDDGGTGLTKEKILAAFELRGNNDAQEEESTCVVGWKQWSELMDILEFKNADFVGPEELPWKGIQAKRWLGSLWLPHSGLKKSQGVGYCYWYSRSAIKHVSGEKITTKINYVPERDSYLITCSMSQGAVLVDPMGTVTLKCHE